MRLRISELPAEIKDRLKDIQQNHDEYAGFYQEGGGKGWAIFGMIIGIMTLLGMLALITDKGGTPFGVWVGFAIFTFWVLIASWRSIKRHNAAEIRSFTFLNPLYLTKVTPTHVTYYNLWSDREDLQITHHYTNGVYTNTEFEFTFTDGSETLYVSPKHQAEELIDLIDTYRIHMLESIENEDFEAIMGHDLFFELEHGDGALQPGAEKEKKDGFAWGLWGGVIAGAVAFGGLCFFANNYFVQSGALDYCETVRVPTPSRYNRYSRYSYGPVRCYERYFGRYDYIMFKERAQDGLFDAYKKRFAKDSTSASKVREWMNTTTFKHLDGERAGKLQAHFKQEGEKALKYLYENAITTYKSRAKTAYPEARKAIIKLMELARDQGNYLVKITYKRNIQAANQSSYTLKGRTYRLQPMTPSFKPKHNAAREQVISGRIQKAFKKIIPEDILSFTTDGDLEFNIAYSLRPYSMYIRTIRSTGAKSYFRGIRIFWHLKILNKGKLLYEYLDTTRPAQRFSVRSYRRRYARYTGVPNVTVYDKMAKTVFDNYGRRLLIHFGVKRPLYSDRRARKTWQMYKKLGILKELAAGKSWKELNLKERMKKAGMKVPKAKPRLRRTNYRKRYQRKRYRRKRYNRYRRRYNRYRRRYRRRRPTRRRSWME